MSDLEQESQNLQEIPIVLDKTSIEKKLKGKKKMPEEIPPNIPQIPDISMKETINKIKFPCNVMIVGRTYSGKSSLIRNLIEKRKFDAIWLISQTSANTGEYDKLVDTDMQLENINDDIIEYLYELQDDDPKMKTLIILDDFIDGPRTLHKVEKLVKMATSGRHRNISLLMSTQNLTSIPASMRKQCLCIFAGKQFMSSAEQFGKDFANNQLDMKQLKKKIMSIEDRHDWLVLNARTAKWSLLPQEEIKLNKYSRPKRVRKKKSSD
jgi:hypothetical protein